MAVEIRSPNQTRHANARNHNDIYTCMHAHIAYIQQRVKWHSQVFTAKWAIIQVLYFAYVLWLWVNESERVSDQANKQVHQTNERIWMYDGLNLSIGMHHANMNKQKNMKNAPIRIRKYFSFNFCYFTSSHGLYLIWTWCIRC